MDLGWGEHKYAVYNSQLELLQAETEAFTKKDRDCKLPERLENQTQMKEKEAFKSDRGRANNQQ